MFISPWPRQLDRYFLDMDRATLGGAPIECQAYSSAKTTDRLTFPISPIEKVQMPMEGEQEALANSDVDGLAEPRWRATPPTNQRG